MIAHTVSNAHLVIPVDFVALISQLDSFCDSIQHFHNIIYERPTQGEILKGLAARFKGLALERCQKLNKEIQTVKDIWVPNPISTPDRPKRGGGAAVVGVGIAAAAAVMFSQIYSQNELTSLISQTQKQTEKHIKTLAESISINSDNILELNRTFSLLQNNSVNEFVKIQDMQTITSMSMTLGTLESDFAHILSGLVMLSQHKLSPALIAPSLLRQPLAELQATLWESKISLSIDDAYDMFQLDVSHVMLTNYTLLIYIHIPCFSPQHLLKLYQYRQLQSSDIYSPYGDPSISRHPIF